MLHKIFRKILLLYLAVLFCSVALIGCSTRQNNQPQQNQQGEKKIKIGFSIASLREEYFGKVEEALQQRAEELGVDFITLSANNNNVRQIAQAKSIVDSGVDVLIVTPHNAELSAEIVEYAHSKGVPVVAFDRIILNSDLDAYVSINHEKVGQLQAEYLTKIAPTGNYVYIGGPATDYNSELLRKGVLEFLQPYKERQDITLVFDEKMADWQGALAQTAMAQALRDNNNNIAAVIAANDNLAGGVIAALGQEQLARKVPVVGMDADLAALQRILEGEQTMTVYKPIEKAADDVLNVAMALAQNGAFDANAAIYNGKIEVPSVLIEPVVADKSNIMDIPERGNNEKIVIGYSMDTLREERWKRDRDAMLQKAQELDVDLRILVANSNDARQIAQSKELVDQGVDVLIVAPHNAQIASEIVEYAHSKGVPVLSYDRLIQNADVDAFVSVNHEQIGRQQAEYVTAITPTGNYVYIGGAPTDSNAPLLRKGSLEALQPYIQRGEIQLVLDKMAADWSPALAQEYMREALDITNNNITAVIAANDNLAGAVNTALTEKGLQGKVLVTGMDADLAALRRMVNGLQTMTVLKPIDPLTSTALEAAIALAKNEKVPTNAVVYNGKIDVPSYLIQPVVVDNDNILDTIINPGYETYENIYR